MNFSKTASYPLSILAFFVNIVMCLGVKGVIGIFSPTKNRNKDLSPKLKFDQD